MVELIGRDRLCWVQLNSLLSEELSGEQITADNPEDVLAEVHINADVEVLPGVVVVTTERLWDFLSAEEHALWDPTVLDLGLRDEDCPVIEVEVDHALADSVVLVGVLHDRFLEVSSETQHRAVILQPTRLNPWDVLILGLR